MKTFNRIVSALLFVAAPMLYAQHAGHGAHQSAPAHDHRSVESEAHHEGAGAFDPARTLQPDHYDVPAEASVADAHKAHQSERTGAHAGHESSAPASRAAVVYACPMHPEVTSDKPGTCPKCGMELEKKD